MFCYYFYNENALLISFHNNMFRKFHLYLLIYYFQYSFNSNLNFNNKKITNKFKKLHRNINCL